MDIIPCLIIFLFNEIKGRPGVIGVSKSRVYLYCLITISDGLVILVDIIIGKSPIIVGLTKPRVYFDGLAEIRDRLVILTLFVIGRPSIDVCLNIIRI